MKDSEQIREGLIKSVVSTLGDGGRMGGVKTILHFICLKSGVSNYCLC